MHNKSYAFPTLSQPAHLLRQLDLIVFGEDANLPIWWYSSQGFFYPDLSEEDLTEELRYKGSEGEL